jgi:hypothetical protein
MEFGRTTALPYERRLASEQMTRCYRAAKTGNRATSKLSDYVAA